MKVGQINLYPIRDGRSIRVPGLEPGSAETLFRRGNLPHTNSLENGGDKDEEEIENELPCNVGHFHDELVGALVKLDMKCDAVDIDRANIDK